MILPKVCEKCALFYFALYNLGILYFRYVLYIKFPSNVFLLKLGFNNFRWIEDLFHALELFYFVPIQFV